MFHVQGGVWHWNRPIAPNYWKRLNWGRQTPRVASAILWLQPYWEAAKSAQAPQLTAPVVWTTGSSPRNGRRSSRRAWLRKWAPCLWAGTSPRPRSPWSPPPGGPREPLNCTCVQSGIKTCTRISSNESDPPIKGGWIFFNFHSRMISKLDDFSFLKDVKSMARHLNPRNYKVCHPIRTLRESADKSGRYLRVERTYSFLPLEDLKS